MITVSPAAATQILSAAQQSKADGIALRLAIQQKSDNSFHYLMGFDDKRAEDDLEIESEGIQLVINAESQKLSAGLKLDYVELDGKMEFVFLNPNDPAYSPPIEA
jgi:iron-sulfur cluster assembly accessory protein